MAIKKLLPEDFELFSIFTNPQRYYSSSSITGLIEGTLNVFARHSKRLKESQPTSFYSSSFFRDKDLNRELISARISAKSGSNIEDIKRYMSGVNEQPISSKIQGTQDIIRFTPSVVFDTNSLRKTVVVDTLAQYYRTVYPSANLSFGNYHSLNFFTSLTDSTIPTGSVLLYPNPITTNPDNTITGRYIPTGSFTFDFWINLRNEYGSGTIMHLSSCYALSVITGSSKDNQGLTDKYRLLLQLSSSADLDTTSIPNLGNLPQHVFISDDDVLLRDNWHHVSIKWGTNSLNRGTGSFVVDGVDKGYFVIPSSSIIPTTFSPTRDNPTVLCVGNHYKGTNVGSDSLAYFFSTDTSQREGLEELIADTGALPLIYKFDQPLHAEIHDLKLYNKCLTSNEIYSLSLGGPKDLDGLLFYLPPFFTYEAPTQKFYNGYGGKFETPFFTSDGTTTTPFSSEMSFGVGGHYINLENFTRDFANGVSPRLLELTNSIGNENSQIPHTANELLYVTGSNKKRNYTILPNDNGSFYPNFNLLSPLNQSRFVNDLGNKEMGSVSLRNLISTSSIFQGLGNETTGSLLDSIMGATPETFHTATNENTYAVLQRTRDNSSNQLVFFDISNLYYGDSIHPGTLILTDTNLSSSGDVVKIQLKDDKYGNIYRADHSGSCASWNSVGNVYYNEGIVVLKHPSLYFFGKNQFSISFKGERNVHVQTFTLTANPYEHISSSNPSYIPVSASTDPSDKDQQFVYVSNINIHDDNLNVIMKTNLAQPIQLKSSDKIVFKTKMDW